MSERLTDADIAAIAVSGHDGRAHAVPRWACRSLAAEVQASRKLIADLRVEHEYRQGGLFDHCVLCGVRWPCPTIALIEEAGL